MSKKRNHWQRSGPLYSLTASMGDKQVKVSFWSGDEEDSDLKLSTEANGLKSTVELSPGDALRLAGLLLNATEQHKKQSAVRTERKVKAYLQRKAKADKDLAGAFQFFFGSKP